MMLIYKIDRRNRGFIDEKTRRNSCNILDDVADRTEDPSVISTIDILSEQAERILENKKEKLFYTLSVLRLCIINFIKEA